MAKKRNWEEGLDDGIKFLRKDGDHIFCEFEGFEFRVSRNNWPPKRFTEQLCLHPTEYFIYRISKIHTELNFSKVMYSSDLGKVEVSCQTHGSFVISAGSLKQGHGCRQCGISSRVSKTKSTTSDFIEKSIKVHGDLYEYSAAEYKGDSEKVSMLCKFHGLFRQLASNHLQGAGCPNCAEDSRHGYRKSRYVANCEKKYEGLSKLYLVSCMGYGELFYKIGITSTTVSKRFACSRALPYNWESLHQVTGPAGTIWDAEKLFHKYYKEKSYTPEIKFAGSTECFLDIDLEEFKRLCEEFKIA